MPQPSATPERLVDPAVLARMRGLRLRAERIVEGFVSGLHRSPYQGFSNEFAEHREYVPGDDLRYVDWRAFGKTDKVYVKRYEEETNLIGYLVLDISESMTYRSESTAARSNPLVPIGRRSANPLPEAATMSKLEYAQTAAAALAYLILRQQDAVGLATFDDRVRTLLRPSGSPSHLLPLLTTLAEASGGEKTSAGPIFHELAERLGRRGVVIILSDLFDDPDELLAGLKHFRCRRHDVIVMHVLDPAELDFPFEQPTLFKGLERLGELLVDPARLRKAYREEFAAFQQRVASGCRTQGADYVLMRTDRPLEAALTAYLHHRQARLH
ncbi:DUF58 domain-containing protein [Botrimarina hoheduenensis]|uniref:DUF58 domain-containing protein n=1 Tax=Botrimarina hoheduenensis TaxID=2528000 RepID=A0A5C5VWH4_9BACT|nr:DUF58 domain-containing protein [Botrimarina hoheduenensis]TWT42874.1 hypothetical protein Pla111_25120 [Botrimarina hoheduenensis]